MIESILNVFGIFAFINEWYNKAESTHLLYRQQGFFLSPISATDNPMAFLGKISERN